MILFRPVGLKELELIAQANFKAFPPRLPGQPIFYPVLNFEYAEQIAREWNTKTSPFAGFITRFEVEQSYAEQFEVHTVGSRIHRELWVPAKELDEFNRHIVGQIEIVAAYYGEQFVGEIDSTTNLPVEVLRDQDRDRGTLSEVLYRRLGHSDVNVSVFALGSWMTYEFMDETDALAVMNRALDAGINFLDDARYNDRTGTAPIKTGYSEVIFGNLVRKTGRRRSELFITNKLWYEFYPEQSPEEELDSSLSRLQMDYLDLVYCVAPPPSLPVTEMVKQMDDLIKTGKLRYWGVLNWSPAQIEEACRIAKTNGMSAPCAAQLVYSVLYTTPVEDAATQKLFAANGISVVASYSLHGGLLSGKYHQSEGVAQGRFKAKDVDSMRDKGLFDKAERFTHLAQELDCTPAQLALAFCLKNDQVASVLFGATKVSQVEENLGALEILPRIDQSIMAQLRNLE